MNPAPPQTHRRDAMVITGGVVFALALAWGTAVFRIRDLRAEKAAQAAKADEVSETQSVDWLTACNTELNTFCAAGRAPFPCLKNHRAALSSECAGRIVNFEKIQPWRIACGDDAYRLCPNMLGYDGKECLSQHLSEVSTACRTFYATLSAAANL